MTMVELMISVGLIAAGGGALLFGVQASSAQRNYLNQFQMALNEAQGAMDEMAATSFDTLCAGGQFLGAYPNQGGQQDISASLSAATTNPLTGLTGVVMVRQIKPFPFAASCTNQTTLDLSVAVCWNARGRTIGENQNGRLCVDANADGWVTSPAMVSTRVSNDG